MKRLLILTLADSIFILLSMLGASWLVSDLNFFSTYTLGEILVSNYEWYLIFIVVQILFFILQGHYQIIYRYSSLYDIIAQSKSILFSTAISFSILILFFSGFDKYPRSASLIYLILNIILINSLRIVVRIYFSHFYKNPFKTKHLVRKKLILIGAGGAGEKIAREIINNPNGSISLVGFVDDDQNKIGKTIHGFPILCNLKSLLDLRIPYDELLICVPSASRDQIIRIVNICKKTGKLYKTVPNLVELIDKEVNLSNIRDVSYVDLLGREEIRLEMNLIKKMLSSKRILISGAGGSIGSELVKQCITFNPSEIICLDINEEKIFELNNLETNKNMVSVLKPVLADVNNKNELEKVF